MFHRLMTGLRGSGAAAAVAVAVLVGSAACGTVATHPGASPSTQPNPTAAPASAFQALVGGVQKGNSGPITLYDSATGRNTALGVLGGVIRFAGPGRLSFLAEDGGLVSAKLDGTDRRVEVGTPVLEYGWRSDGTLAYVTDTNPGAPDDRGQLVIRPAGGGPPATADLGPGVAFAGVPQQVIQFSPDGKLVMVAQTTFGSSPLSIRRLDGTVLFVPQGTHGGWAPDGSLYYSNDAGIFVADPVTGATRTVVGGVRWYNPAVSLDGHYAVFEQWPPIDQGGGTSTQPWLRVLDTRNGTIVPGFQLDASISAHFVGPSRFWFQRIVHQDSPDLRPVVAYDLATMTESQTGLTGTVWDVHFGGSS